MQFTPPDVNLFALLPMTLVAITAMVVLLQAVLSPQGAERTVPTSLVGLAAAAIASGAALFFAARFSFVGMLLVDRSTIAFYLMFLAAAAIAIPLAADHLEVEGLERGEAAALFLIATVGMMLMASSGNLIMVFLGLETMSVALYILSGLLGARDRASNEAAVKYLLLGAFATGFLLYGMAMVYGATGTLDLALIREKVATGAAQTGFLNTGLALLTIGLGFKVALVPFHMWTPDVYEGAPTAVTAFMSVGAKVAGFAALMRVFSQGAQPVAAAWQPAMIGLAVVTMLVGNVAALTQTSLKRMLAFSSIAHAGYLLVGILPATMLGVQAVLFYSLAYTLMNLGAFVVVMAVADGHNRPELDSLRGLWRRSPLVATAMAVFMLSLTGIPPFSGFLGKWLLLNAAVNAQLTWVAAAMVICSAISAFYYLRVVVVVFMDDSPAEGLAPLVLPARTRGALWACLLGTIVLSIPIGLLFYPLSGWAAGAP